MEFVYVTKRSDLFHLAYPQGFQPLDSKALEDGYLQRIRNKGFFIERRFAEQDSSFKQIIPYCVVVQKGKVLVLRRLKNQGESRLHQKLSIGVGGHINPQDQEGDILQAGTLRELSEEISIEGKFQISPVGIINDDASEVGSVHFGIVQRVVVESGKIEIRENTMMEGSLTSIDELKQMTREKAEFESWSAFLIQHIDSILKEH